jgi:hypothetical protein
MFGMNFDAKTLKLIGQLTQDVNKLKEFLHLAEMAPAIFKAFKEAHPLQEGEFTATIFLQELNGQLFISAATMNIEGVPMRPLFQWNYQEKLAQLNIAALMDNKEQLASGQLSWSQIIEMLKIKPEQS